MWEPSLLGLLARLAEDAPGMVDTSDLLPCVFTRVQKMFGLPVHYNKTNVGYRGQQLDSGTAARWIVATIGGGSETQGYLCQLLASLESYYHPANSGKHILKLVEFLAKLVESFIRRVHRERHRKPSWGARVPLQALLTDLDITEFVVSVKPVVFHAMWSRFKDLGPVLQSLATLRPELILPTLVNRLYRLLLLLLLPLLLPLLLLLLLLLPNFLLRLHYLFYIVLLQRPGDSHRAPQADSLPAVRGGRGPVPGAALPWLAGGADSCAAAPLRYTAGNRHQRPAEEHGHLQVHLHLRHFPSPGG